MLSQVAKRTVSIRAFSTSRIALTEGAINQANNAFSEKEKAQENAYVKKHEAEQLKALKDKLQQQKETIDKLEQEIKSIKK